MCKEDKLEELGYSHIFDGVWAKEDENFVCSITLYCEYFDNTFAIYIKDRNEINRDVFKQEDIDKLKGILSKEQIDNLQNTFNNIKKDFEEVMKCDGDSL